MYVLCQDVYPADLGNVIVPARQVEKMRGMLDKNTIGCSSVVQGVL